MASGIEIVGVTLAIFPVVVAALNSYAKSVQGVKEMWRYTIALDHLRSELSTEQCKFENTCTLLLEGIVSGSDLLLLIKEPRGPLWRASHIQQGLERCLRPKTVQCYMERIQSLMLTLETLQKDLELYGDGMSQPADRKMLKKQLRKIRLYVSKPEYKERLAYMVKINADLETLTGQRKSASSLPPLIQAANHYKRIRNHAISLYDVLKERLQATPLAACGCTIPHYASLRLEVRPRSTPATRKPQGEGTSLRFHVAISFENDSTRGQSLPQNWQEMGIEPLDNEQELLECRQSKADYRTATLDSNERDLDIEACHMTVEEGNSLGDFTAKVSGKFRSILREYGASSITTRNITPPLPGLASKYPKRQDRPPQTSRVSFNLDTGGTGLVPIHSDSINAMKKIENLCLTIQQAKNEISCFGVLTGASNQRYRIWPPRMLSLASEPTDVVSLKDILDRPGTLKMKDQLILGVQLASAVMQLHTTEWLGENWGKRDILFHQEKTSGTINMTPEIRSPFIRRILASPDPPSPTIQGQLQSVFIPHDQSLFSLGVILVELCYGKCLEDLRIETDKDGFSNIPGMSDMIDYVTTKRISGQIHETAGQKYSDAVRRCINGLDHQYSSLGADEFKNEVHMKVVTPLVENLESFCGMGLEELIQKENIGTCITDCLFLVPLYELRLTY